MILNYTALAKSLFLYYTCCAASYPLDIASQLHALCIAWVAG